MFLGSLNSLTGFSCHDAKQKELQVHNSPRFIIRNLHQGVSEGSVCIQLGASNCPIDQWKVKCVQQISNSSSHFGKLGASNQWNQPESCQETWHTYLMAPWNQAQTQTTDYWRYCAGFLMHHDIIVVTSQYTGGLCVPTVSGGFLHSDLLQWAVL